MPRNKIIFTFSVLFPLLIVAVLVAYGRRAAVERAPVAGFATVPEHATMKPEFNAEIERLRQAVGRDPDNAGLRIKLAMYYWHGGDAVAGVAELDRVLAKDPDQLEAWYYKGILLINTPARQAEGASVLQQLIARAPSSPQATKAQARLAGARPAPAATTAAPPPQLPATLGGLPLTGFTQGAAAQAKIRELHPGSEFPLDAAWTGDYGAAAGGRSASVWLAESANPRELLTRMADGLAGGGTPFSAPARIVLGGVEVYVTRRRDEVNYFWVQGNTLTWLSVPGFSDAPGRALLQEMIAGNESRLAPLHLQEHAR